MTTSLGFQKLSNMMDSDLATSSSVPSGLGDVSHQILWISAPSDSFVLEPDLLQLSVLNFLGSCPYFN